MVPPAVHSSARRWPSTSLTAPQRQPYSLASLVRTKTGCKLSLYRDEGQRKQQLQSDPQRRARGTQKLGEILGQAPEQVERSLGDVSAACTYVLERSMAKSIKAPCSILAHDRSSPSRRWRRSGPRPRNCEPTSAEPCGCGVSREETGRDQ